MDNLGEASSSRDQMPAVRSAAKSGAATSVFDNPSALRLWNHYHAAARSLDNAITVEGFLDVVVFGSQSTGKSTLLGTLTGLALPTGSQTVTRCPIRIIVDPNATGTSLVAKLRGGQEHHVPLPDNVLSKEIYMEAVRKLNIADKREPDELTDRELQVIVGQKECLPLNVVDLPGFTTYAGQHPARSDDVNVGSIVESFLGETGDDQRWRPLLPIMTCKADTDLANTVVQYVEGRPFLTVFTHADLLENDFTGKLRNLRALAQKLKTLNCGSGHQGAFCGCFLIGMVDDGKGIREWSAEEYSEFCEKHGCESTVGANLDSPDSSHKQGFTQVELESMCGTAKLLQELQSRQTAHILSKRAETLSKLRDYKALLDTQDCLDHMNAQNIKDSVVDALFLVQQALQRADEGRTEMLEGGAPDMYKVAAKRLSILGQFAENAFRQGMGIVEKGLNPKPATGAPDTTWAPDMLPDWGVHAGNIIQPALKVVYGELARAARTDLLNVFERFITWRSEVEFNKLHLASDHLTGFISEYMAQKRLKVETELNRLMEELTYSSVFANDSSPYLAFEGKQEEVKELLGARSKLAESLAGTAPYSGPEYRLYDTQKAGLKQERATKEQRIKILAYLHIFAAVETVSRHLSFVILTRSYRLLKPGGQDLADQTLTSAFKIFQGSDADQDMQKWVGVSLEDKKQKSSNIDMLIKTLDSLDLGHGQAGSETPWVDYTAAGRQNPHRPTTPAGRDVPSSQSGSQASIANAATAAARAAPPPYSTEPLPSAPTVPAGSFPNTQTFSTSPVRRSPSTQAEPGPHNHRHGAGQASAGIARQPGQGRGPAGPQGTQRQIAGSPPAHVSGQGRGGLQNSFSPQEQDAINDIMRSLVGQDTAVIHAAHLLKTNGNVVNQITLLKQLNENMQG